MKGILFPLDAAMRLNSSIDRALIETDDETKRSVEKEYLDSIEPFRKGARFEIPGEFVVVEGLKQ